jgi:hypothetical protein
MFSALLNAQNKSGGAPIPLTSAVFQYSNNDDDWFNLPSPFPAGIGVPYDGNTYSLRVFSVSPAGAIYTTYIDPPISQGGQTAQAIITGTSGYSGTIASGVLQIIGANPTIIVSTEGYSDDNQGAYFIYVSVQPALAQGVGIGYSDNYGGSVGNLTGTPTKVTGYAGYDFVPAPATLSWFTNNTQNWNNQSGSVYLAPL